MNLLTKHIKTHRLRKGNCGCEGRGRIVREFRKVMYTLLYSKWKPTRTYCIAHGTLLNVMCQPGWEEGLEENGYMYMYD